MKIFKAGKLLTKKWPFSKAAGILKASETGVKSLDDVFSGVVGKAGKTHMEINGVSFKSVVPDLKLGNLFDALKKLKITHTLSPNIEASFKKIVGDIDIKAKNIDAKFDGVKSVHKDLDISPKDVGKLTPAAKTKLSGMLNTLKKGAKIGAVVALGYGAWVIGKDLVESFAEAAAQETGCFIIDKKNKCKISTLSCANKDGTPCSNNVTSLLHPNVFNYVQNKTDPAFLGDIPPPNSKSDADVKAWIEALSDDDFGTLFDKVSELPLSEVTCETGCRGCDPSASERSPNFVDDSDLPTNMSILCNTRSSILGSVIGSAIENGLDIFGSASESLSSLKPFIYMFIIGFVIIILISLGLKFIPKRRADGGGGGGGGGYMNGRNEKMQQ